MESARDFHNHIVNKVHVVKSLMLTEVKFRQLSQFSKNIGKMLLLSQRSRSSHHFRVYDSNNLIIERTSTSLMTKIPVFHESGNEDSDIELATRSKLRYQNVYSDCTSGEEIMQPAKLPVIGFKSQAEVLSGMYVLAEVPCEDG